MKILTLNKPEIKDFAKARNVMMNNCDVGWILFLDSDEKLSQKLNQSFNNSLNQYALIRKNYFLGQYVGTDKIVRLVKKGTGKWIRAVHETWKPNKFYYRVGMLKTPIIIHNTANNLKTYIDKINNYSNLHAKENEREGKNSNLFKIIFYPIVKFTITLIKSKNVVFSIMQSLHSFLAWTKLYLHQF